MVGIILILQTQRCIIAHTNYVPKIANYFDMGDLMAMAYPKFFVQVSGIEDKIFPIYGAEEVFEKGKNAYASEGFGERCTLIKGNG